MPKTKVAMYIPDLTGGGAERAMLKLASGLSNEGYDVDFLVSNAQGAYMSQLPTNINFIDMKAGQPRSSIKPLIEYLQKEKPTALISGLHNANVVALWARKMSGVKTKTILTIQNNFSAEKKIAKSRHAKLMLFCATRFYHMADEITCVSHGVANDLAASLKLPRSRVRVIWNPIVSEALVNKSREPVAHPWFSKGQPPVILSVGRLNPQKDYGMLLEAFVLVKSKLKCRLMILGEGEERANLEQKAHSLGLTLGVDGDTLLPGFADNPFAYMNKAAVFALSSRHEGLPTVLIEALASGASIVSTDCPSGPDEILAGGKYGYLSPVGDPNELARNLLSVLSNGSEPPPDESWKPYTEDACVKAFSKLISVVPQ